jgi:hypothetical protein
MTSTPKPLPRTHTATRLAGWSLISAAVGFIAVFSYLAARFDYPDVLNGSAADVLPKLLELGSAGRAVWAIYALLPLLLIPAGVGAYAALRNAAPSAMRAAVVFSTITAVSMLIGLARWPTVHWELAQVYVAATPDVRTAVDAVFGGLNLYLGNFIGEFLGEVSLNIFFLLTAYGFAKSESPRWIGYVGATAGVIGLIAAFRNVTTAVELVADINNLLLPIWLVVLGIVMLWIVRRSKSSF